MALDLGAAPRVTGSPDHLSACSDWGEKHGPHSPRPKMTEIGGPLFIAAGHHGYRKKFSRFPAAGV
jgi:hypothetical protein